MLKVQRQPMLKPQNPKTIKYYPELNSHQKEAWLRSDVKIRLAIKNFLVAIPEPDIGEDIWFSRPNQDDYFIYAAQIKSSFTVRPLREDRLRRYQFSISLNRLESSLQRKFFYFFGLYNPDSNNFLVGCFPSSFFHDHWDFIKQKKISIIKSYQGIHKTRVNIEIDYDLDTKEFFIFMKPPINATLFFNSFDAIP